MSGLDFVPGGDGWAMEGYFSGNAETRREPIVAPIPFTRYNDESTREQLANALLDAPADAEGGS